MKEYSLSSIELLVSSYSSNSESVVCVCVCVSAGNVFVFVLGVNSLNKKSRPCVGVIKSITRYLTGDHVGWGFKEGPFVVNQKKVQLPHHV